MPVRPAVLTRLAACTGRSMPSFVPLPQTSSGSPVALAAVMVATISPSPACSGGGRGEGVPRSLMARRSCGAGRHRGFAQREYFCRVEQPVGVEGRLDAALLVQLDGAELHAHQVALLDADAVLAGQATAGLDAEFQDVGAKSFRRVEAGRVVGV